MRGRFRTVLYVVYAIALGMGVLLSWLTYDRTQAVQQVAMPLVTQDIPSLRIIADLKGEITGREPIVYEYYASTDRERFTRRIEASNRRIGENLAKLGALFPDNPELSGIAAMQAESMQMSAALATMLQQPQIDVATAQSLISHIAENSVGINARLDTLVGELQTGVSERGALTQSRLHDIVNLVALFSAMLFVAALLLGYYFNAYLKGAAERRRLAMFPERNLNPVMSLNSEGWILYANPGAEHLRERLGASLLPPDIGERLLRLRQNGTDHGDWEYAVSGRTLSCHVHYLADFDTWHAYVSDITERKQAEDQLHYQAYHDVLTGLPNRRRFDEALGSAMTGGTNNDGIALLLLSLDRFRSVVDTLGHAAGDNIIRAVADRLSGLVDADNGNPAGIGLYRIEGTFFSILLRPSDAAPDAMQLAQTIAAAMKAPFMVDGRELFFSVSIGIAQSPQDGQDAVSLFRAADGAVQEVKQQGGDAIHCCGGMMGGRALEYLETEHALRRAEQRRELELHYQPQLDIRSGRIIGVEALIRWRRPEHGLVSPAEFIPLAEETGMIVPIGAWVLRTACAQGKAWQDAGLAPLTVAVNLSARQFLDPGLAAMVADVLKETGLDAEYLELEVTEGAVMHNVEMAIATLNALRGIGIKLSVDDFGTGYSSLAYLKRFPIDKLKVDQSFVRHMQDDANDAAIVQAVINLGHSLNLKVIAEGVELPEHLALLRAYGCEEMQGYLFSKPRPVGEITEMLADGRGLAAL
jgi:diguanylate cyclase (GGDEF)-like protein